MPAVIKFEAVKTKMGFIVDSLLDIPSNCKYHIRIVETMKMPYSANVVICSKLPFIASFADEAAERI